MRTRALSSHKKRTAKEILKVKPWQKRKEEEKTKKKWAIRKENVSMQKRWKKLAVRECTMQLWHYSTTALCTQTNTKIRCKPSKLDLCMCRPDFQFAHYFGWAEDFSQCACFFLSLLNIGLSAFGIDSCNHSLAYHRTHNYNNLAKSIFSIALYRIVATC